ncbi:MAG: hypothetical protein KJO94_00295, partial [Eudoraea sp.]|nr:hypothetical protein [Eudoraea sp.]
MLAGHKKTLTIADADVSILTGKAAASVAFTWLCLNKKTLTILRCQGLKEGGDLSLTTRECEHGEQTRLKEGILK